MSLPRLTSGEKKTGRTNIKPEAYSWLTWSRKISITMCCSCYKGSSIHLLIATDPIQETGNHLKNIKKCL